MDEQRYLAQYNIKDYDLPLTTVDMAIFGIIDHALHVLLVKRAAHPAIGRWALPGGFVDVRTDLDVDAAASRKLIEKTGVAVAHLEQVQSIGNATRDPRGWSLTVLYFALIDVVAVDLSKLTNSVEHAQWVNVHEVNQYDLAFDHNQLLSLAMERLRRKTRYTALPMSLLPDQFTLTELQRVFETILGHALEKKSFRRRLLDADVLEETQNSKIAGKRPAKLYRAKPLPRDFEFPRSV